MNPDLAGLLQVRGQERAGHFHGPIAVLCCEGLTPYRRIQIEHARAGRADHHRKHSRNESSPPG